MQPAATYLDYNATAPVRPEAVAAIVDALAIGGNPSSVHRFGRMARAVIDKARRAVADLLLVDASRVTFTSGGTEANALAIRALVATGAKGLLISAVEHDSVRAAAAASGIPVHEIPVDASGVIDINALEAMLADGGPWGVAVMLANNETGVIQPIGPVLHRVHAAGGWLLCDAVQAVGRGSRLIGIATGADLLTISAHKLGGPQGVGALVAGPRVRVEPMVRGGQESGLRGGTENVPGIAGFGAAATVVARQPATGSDRMVGFAATLESRLRAASPELQVFGSGAKRLRNTACFALPGISAETAVIALDLAGVAVSAGAACSSGKVGRSHVLKAMGVPDELAACALRVSFGWASTAADIDRFMVAWTEMVVRVRRNERGGLPVAM